MRHFEDFTVGDTYRSAVGRTVTETDNLLFTMLSLNTNELHFNEEAAKETEWGRILVNSAFTLSLVLGLSVADTSQAGAVNLGWTEIRLPHPVFVGDTIWTETEVTSARASESRPTHGIVGVRTRGINQRREVVCEFARSFLIAKNASASDSFPGTDESWGVA
ncbi:MAG: itaconyl-CoA hydratase [Gaiellaceae bacterium]|jgi:itaconyl-CoA hydratase|nr:itaconyl-CoA hydratase [Gaiellaceae bacterium]